MSSSEHTKKGLYTIIYPFMSKSLNLAGLAKECFAVIFRFWLLQGQKPVSVSLTTMQTITGGTRPAVVQAVHKLEEFKLLVALRRPREKTKYDVTIPEQVLADFKAQYATGLVKQLNHEGCSRNTSTSVPTLLRNNIKTKHKSVITPLKVKTASEIRTGGLKEA